MMIWTSLLVNNNLFAEKSKQIVPDQTAPIEEQSDLGLFFLLFAFPV